MSISRECKNYWETGGLIQHFSKLFKLNPSEKKNGTIYIFFLQRVSIFNEPDLWNQLSLYTTRWGWWSPRVIGLELKGSFLPHVIMAEPTWTQLRPLEGGLREFLLESVVRFMRISWDVIMFSIFSSTQETGLGKRLRERVYYHLLFL